MALASTLHPASELVVDRRPWLVVAMLAFLAVQVKGWWIPGTHPGIRC
jgi:hypothetical protein